MSYAETKVERESFAERIREVFKDHAMPETVRAGTTMGYRHSMSPLEGDWRTLTTEQLRGNRDYLHFLNPEGFAYYLPAFLIFCLLDPSTADSLVGHIYTDLSPENFYRFTPVGAAMPQAQEIYVTDEMRFAPLEQLVAARIEGDQVSAWRAEEAERIARGRRYLESAAEHLTVAQKQVILDFLVRYYELFLIDFIVEGERLARLSAIHFWYEQVKQSS